MEDRLQDAVEAGDLLSVKELVRCGADIHAKDDDGRTALIAAAENGHVNVVRYLVEHDANIHVETEDGSSALTSAGWNGHLDVVRYLVEQGAGVEGTVVMTAGWNGHVDVVRYLVEQGANKEANDEYCYTALMRAAEYGHLNVVQYLVEQGADIHAKHEEGGSGLMLAAKRGHIDVVRYLVEQGADKEASDVYGTTALLVAVEYGHLNVVQYLVEQGADIHATHKKGYTGLMLAAERDHLDVVQYLVEEGADVDAKNKDGITALMRAGWRGHLDVIRYLVERGADIKTMDNKHATTLFYAAFNGQLDVVRYLVEQRLVNKTKNEDINSTKDEYSTALISAAANGHMFVVRYLEEHGADFNRKKNLGSIALTKAAANGNMNAMRYLVERGADKEANNNEGNTALMLAVLNRHVDVMRYLVEQGANKEAKNNDGNTALMLAASNRRVDVVRYFVEQGAGKEVKNNDGNTALLLAAENGDDGVMRYLVEHGVDINARNKNGDTSIILAAGKGIVNVVRYLVKHGADANTKNMQDETAVYQATKHGHIEIRNFLLRHIKHVRSGECVMNANLFLTSLAAFLTSTSWAISPFDIKLVEYDGTKTIGGEYRAKWLDADVVVKHFVPDASASTFVEEVTTWHQLRHPNVIKLYGACNIGHSFFVLEYTSNGSVVEYLAECKRKGKRKTPWKFLCDAALGLAYLHERGIVHGNLRSSNILVGNDGVAKLADFGMVISSQYGPEKKSPDRSDFGSVRWRSPEQLNGDKASFSTDIYSFGLCAVAAVTGQEPWEGQDEQNISECKFWWTPSNNSELSISVLKEFADWGAPVDLDDNTRLLTSRMCGKNPDERVTAAAVVRLLEKLAAREASELGVSQPQQHNIKMNADEYKGGDLIRLSAKIQELISSQYALDPLYQFVLQEIEAIHERLAQVTRLLTLLEAYHSLLNDLNGFLQSGSLRNRVVALSSTQAAGNNLTVFRRRINDLWLVLDDTRVGDQERERQWDLQRKKQLELFVSDVSQTVTVLSEFDDEEKRTTLMTLLKLEIDSPGSKYTSTQHAVMTKAYEDCCQGEWKSFVMTFPVWYLPWYELVVDKLARPIGRGGFGEVYLAKWLDSEVVVKEVKTLGSDSSDYTSNSRQSTSRSTVNVRAEAITGDIESRKERRAMFEQEVNVWFGLNHPHVIRLFGACHVGTPFFACEYASNGSLDKYLLKHPDEIWTKLFEAALGVQYLQSRGIIHGDLKCDNIMIGNDGNAKVTDFGLSSFEDADESKLSCAWQWVAPECIENVRDGVSSLSFASDVYSLGMCIVEALRVVEKVDDFGPPPLPWGDSDNVTVKVLVVTKCRLPPRPPLCTEVQWQLVERMCTHDPDKRIKISTVVDELAVFARCKVSFDIEEVEPERELCSLSEVIPETKCHQHFEEGESEREWSSLSEVIIEMKGMCHQLFDNTESRNHKLLCKIYELLWDRLAYLTSASEKSDGVVDVECLTPLVERAQKSTLTLESHKDTLVSFTETALGGYALHRELEKVLEAKTWQVGEDACEWKEKCWALLTSWAEL